MSAAEASTAPPEAVPAIEVSDLSKRFGEVLAVDGVSFALAPGEVVGFLGPNGAGKTTTMRVLTGFLPASDGTVRIAGHDVQRRPLLARRAIGYLSAAVFLGSIPPMINMKIFVPWDLTFGSGMQTLGALVAVLAVAWSMRRADALAQLGGEGRAIRVLYFWLRFVVPGVILSVGLWWLLTEVLGFAGAG